MIAMMTRRRAWDGNPAPAEAAVLEQPASDGVDRDMVASASHAGSGLHSIVRRLETERASSGTGMRSSHGGCLLYRRRERLMGSCYLLE